MSIVDLQGNTLAGGEVIPPSEDLAETPMAPQESAAIRKAIEEAQVADQRLAQAAVGSLLAQEQAREALRQAQEAQENIRKASDRAIKSSGIQAERVRNIDMDRGVIQFVRKHGRTT